MFGIFSDVFDAVIDTASDVVSGTVDLVSDLAGGALDLAGDIAGGAVEAVEAVGDGLFSLGDALLDAAAEAAGGVVYLADSVVEGLDTVVSDVADGVGELVGGFLSLLDGDDSESQAAREAMERRLAALDRELGSKEAAYTGLVAAASGTLVAGATDRSRQALKALKQQLRQDIDQLGQAIGRGKARKEALKQELEHATGARKRALIAELRCISRAMQPLYDQLDRTRERQAALNGTRPAVQ